MQTANQNTDVDIIQAAGGLVWRASPRGKELAVIHRARYDDWTLPKGKLKHGERWQAAALREVQEETGCRVQLGSFAGCVSYLVGGTPKVTLFWNMTLTGECDFCPSEEVDELQWLTVQEALARLNYLGEKALIKQGGKAF
jgi:8-oxo-dGTP pyrophosphatase MutT (NUDIX family)